MNTIAPVKTRFKTLDLACQEIERLEQQVVALNAALASKTAAPAKAQNSTPPSAPVVTPPVKNSSPAASPPTTVERPLSEWNKAELADAADAASQAGDHATSNKFYAEYRRR
jgi:hypothetical protein